MPQFDTCAAAFQAFNIDIEHLVILIRVNYREGHLPPSNTVLHPLLPQQLVSKTSNTVTL